MINIGFDSRYKTHSFNKTTRSADKNTIVPKRPDNAYIPFTGNVNFILVNKVVPLVGKFKELSQIENTLKILDFKELQLGNNVELARLLKSAMFKVKALGFKVPSRIRCESKFFHENPELQKLSKRFTDRHKEAIKTSIPGTVTWDGISEPILYLNTEANWKNGNGDGTKVKDLRHVIWHETGHYLNMMNHKKNPQMYDHLQQTELNPYQRSIVKDCIGIYAADNPVHETIAEIFSRLMSGESYNKLHPEIFDIYSKYRGPMPAFKNSPKP